MKKNFFLFLISLSLQAAGTGNEGGKGKNSTPAPALRSSSTIIFSDNMNGANDTASLHLRGYKTVFNGTGPQSAPTWFQGDFLRFPAYNGPDSGYVAANFEVVTGINRIDSWLILPAFALNQGDTLSFFSRSNFESVYRDSIKVMYSATGNTNINNTDWQELGFFKTDTTGQWRRKAFTAPATGATARFAIRYYLLSGGPSGLASEYIGIDQITIATGILSATTDVNDTEIKLYPNPAQTQVSITGLEQSATVQVINPIGKEIRKLEITAGSPVINVQDWPAGIYFLKISTHKGTTIQKLLKK